MDGMRWHHGSSQVVLSNPSSSSSLRSNNQQLQEDHHQSFMDLSTHEDVLFNPIHQLLHKAHQSSHQLLMINPNPDQRPQEMMTAVAKSGGGAGAGWRDIPSCVSSMPLVGTCVDDHFGLMKNNNGKAGGGGGEKGKGVADTKKKASNSNNNTDTSVDHEDDDDGVSMIFSNSRIHHVWSFGANNNISTAAAAVTVSSGESSENKLQLEETVSQSSSDHHHHHHHQSYSGNAPPTPVTRNIKPSPWCPGNQWLISVMSPSEGLEYKPYTGPCPPTAGFVAPFYGSCGPVSLTPAGGDFLSTAYGVPTSHQQGIGILLGNPPLGQTYFPPYGMPVMNPSISSSAVKQMSPFPGTWTKDNHLSVVPLLKYSK
ncbi:hypothetical protein Q3G72_009866 [Acer saccharum]|nr:hypothetical protein Q3G72_009866 [Acer saccharum]